MGDWRKPTDNMPPLDQEVPMRRKRIQEFADMVAERIMHYAIQQANLWEDQSTQGKLLSAALVSCSLVETAATISAVMAINDSAEGKEKSKALLIERFTHTWDSMVAQVPNYEALKARIAQEIDADAATVLTNEIVGRPKVGGERVPDYTGENLQGPDLGDGSMHEIAREQAEEPKS